MDLIHIAVFTVAAALIGRFAPSRWRGWLVMIASLLAVFWLQPIMPIRGMGFWLPLVTLALTVGIWLIVRQPHDDDQQAGQGGVGWLLLVGVVLLIGLLRYIEPLQFTATTPPPILTIAIALGVLAVLGVAFERVAPKGHTTIIAAAIALIALLVVLKWPPLAEAFSGLLRSFVGQSAAQASPFDLRWLGISYVFFRLLYAMQAYESNKLGQPSLTEFINYVIFFPSFTAGPIAPADKFLKQWRKEVALDWDRFTSAMTRIIVGVFKKYVIADTLALIALNDINALQTDSTLWTWVLLYAYALRIFFDFAGYSDVAIGIGMLLGIKLPENFDDPYRQPTIAQFWNSWHISLALWFRALYFNPLSRWLRKNWKSAPTWALVAITQITTMVLVGIWHGITLNFFIWGAWHGVGLFVHNRYAQATRDQQRALRDKPRLNKVVNTATAVVTVQFVVIGWVWFAIGSTDVSWQVFLRLFGLV